VTGGPAGKEGASAGTEDSTTETEYVDPPKTIMRKVSPPGEVTALSVAVVVDPSSLAGKEGEQQTPAPKVEDFVKIVQNVVPADAKVEVSQATFVHAPTEQEDLAAQGGGLLETILPILRQVSLGVLVLGVLLALKIFAGPKVKPEAVAALESAGEPGRLLPAGAGRTETRALRARITKALQENPEEVKRLFLTWAESEEGET